MRIINETGYTKVTDAIRYFWSTTPKILKEISLLPKHNSDFSYTRSNNYGVAMRLAEVMNDPSVTLKIRMFTPFNPFSRVIGKRYVGSNEIFINSWKIHNLTEFDIAGTIGHEFAHFCGFEHGDNNIRKNTQLKKISVPYAIGNLISGESDFPIGKYRSWMSKKSNQ